MDRKVRWMRIIRFIQWNDDSATQSELVVGTKISRTRISQDLRELGMWYNDYVECSGWPKEYKLTRLGMEVYHSARPLSISSRTRNRR